VYTEDITLVSEVGSAYHDLAKDRSSGGLRRAGTVASLPTPQSSLSNIGHGIEELVVGSTIS
jgi:hypothetical protein